MLFSVSTYKNPLMSGWLCNICREVYLAQEELTNHRQEVHKGKTHKCDLCLLTFFSYQHCKRHLKICLEKTIRKAEEETKAATLSTQTLKAVGAFLQSALPEPTSWDGNLLNKLGKIDTGEYDFLVDELVFEEWFYPNGNKGCVVVS